MWVTLGLRRGYMYHSLKFLKGGIVQGTTIGVIKGDTRSLDYSSYRASGLYGWLSNYGPFLGPYYNTAPNGGPLGDRRDIKGSGGAYEL